MFCINCGTRLPDGSKFCSNCGQSLAGVAGYAPAAQAPAPVYTPAYTSVVVQKNTSVSSQMAEYLQRLQPRFKEAVKYLPELDCYLFYAERFDKINLAPMKEFFFVRQDDDAGYNELKDYSARCLKYALANYTGAVRGISGIAAYAVLCQTNAASGALMFLDKPAPKHPAAFEMPCVIDLTARSLHFPEKTGYVGIIPLKGVQKRAKELLNY